VQRSGGLEGGYLFSSGGCSTGIHGGICFALHLSQSRGRLRGDPKISIQSSAELTSFEPLRLNLWYDSPIFKIELIMPKKISIILWGNIHRDQGAVKMLVDLIKKVHQQGRPIVFCDEDIAEQTLQNRLQGNRQCLEFFNAPLLEKPFIQSLLKRDKNPNYPYFFHADLALIKKRIKVNFPKLSPISVDEYANSLLRHNALKESILLTQLLLKLQIAYMGIECGKIQIEQQRMKFLHEPQVYLNCDKTRILTMADSIVQKALPKLPNNGIVIVNCGVNHVKGLTATLRLQMQTVGAKYDIKLFPLKIFSPYVIDGIENHLNTEAESRHYHGTEIAQAYEQHDLIVCQENIEEDRFESTEVDVALSAVLAHTDQDEVNDRQWIANNRYSSFNYLTADEQAVFSLVTKTNYRILKAYKTLETESPETGLALSI
jgi:hypothetical protein